MIKKHDEPPDDLYAALPEIVAEIVRNLPGTGRTRILGYAIILPDPSVPPAVFRTIGDDNGYRLPFETIDSEDTLFITALLPPGTSDQSCVEIMKNAVRIFLYERAAVIRTKFTVDVARSHYHVRNGVLDITLMKLKMSEETCHPVF